MSRKKIVKLSPLVALVVVVVFTAISSVTAAPADGQVVPGRYIVKITEGVDPAAVAANHSLAPIHTYRAALKGFAAVIPQPALDAIARDPRVAFVEPDRVFTVADQTIPTGIDRVEADQNPNTGIDDANVGVTISYDVAIIDTGINQHEDLNFVGCKNFAGGSPNNCTDGYGHGTHVAGTVGALDNWLGVVGVAPGVRLWAVRVCNNGGICLTSNMIAGIDWVVEQKTSGAIDFAVANMSLGTSDDAQPCSAQTTNALHLAVCGLVDSGVPLALAAGNSSRAKDAYPEVLAVSAIADFDGKAGGVAAATCRSDVDDTLADFSNFGTEVDIAAPGVCILSTSSGGGYALGSGTSMATPHVAGAVALYLHSNGLPPATDRAGVDAIEQAILGAALPEGTENNQCSYDNERGSTEPLLFVNATAFGGNGICEVAGPPVPVTDIAITAVSAPSPVVQGDMVDVSVTVKNVGNQDVTGVINVTLVSDNATPSQASDDIPIGTQTISGGLTAGVSTTLTFSWNTAGANTGNHTLTASHDFVDDDATNNSQSTTVTVNEPTVETAPVVNTCNPDNGNRGDQFIVAVTGLNFQDRAIADFGERVIVQNVTFVSTSQLDVQIKVHPRASSGPRDVTVTNPDGQSGTRTACFSVN